MKSAPCAMRTCDRTASHNFIGGDEHDGPMPLDYYVWTITGNGVCMLLDTGFDAATGAARGRQLVQPVEEGLREVGMDPAAVTDVIVSHMHYDHAGNHWLFPRARYHLQAEEMAHCTGSAMCHAAIRATYEAGGRAGHDRQAVHRSRGVPRRHAQIAPGITVHRVGGHTRGLQVVRVHTRRGWVVLASDAAHFYANWQPGAAVSHRRQRAGVPRRLPHHRGAGQLPAAFHSGPRPAGAGPLSPRGAGTGECRARGFAAAAARSVGSRVSSRAGGVVGETVAFIGVGAWVGHGRAAAAGGP